MKLFYGVNGEGLGHASRTLSVIECLPDCEIHVFTYGAAYRFFERAGYPYLHRVEGLEFSYRQGRVDYARTLIRAVQFCLAGLRRSVDQVCAAARRIRPGLFVSDFEPTVSRAARVCGRGLLSVDNQHRFVHCAMDDLPRQLRAYACCASWATRLMVPRPDHVVIASFHLDERTAGLQHVTVTPGLLRKAVEETRVANEGYMLAYVRASVAEQVLRVLDGCGREVRVFGSVSDELRRYYERRGTLRFYPLSSAFVQQLAGCDRLIATAGNQLICEAQYFQKPMLAIPEPGQYEQYINAWYVARNGLGWQCPARELSGETVERFLSLNWQGKGVRQNGVQQVAQVIRQWPGGVR